MTLVIAHPRSGLTWLRWLSFEASKQLFPYRYAMSKKEENNRLFKFTHDGMGLKRSSMNRTARRLSWNHNPWGRPRVVFLLRDPRDVIWSNWHHIGHDDFSRFLRSPGYGLTPMVDWLRWWGKHRRECRMWNVVYYESLKKNTRYEFKRFLHIIDPSYDIFNDWEIDEMVAECSFEKMRAYEEMHGSILPDVVVGRGRKAVRSGRVGEWRTYWSEEDKAWAAKEIRRLDRTFAEVIESPYAIDGPV